LLGPASTATIIGRDAPSSTTIPIRPRRSRPPTIVARNGNERAREMAITPPFREEVVVAEVIQEGGTPPDAEVQVAALPAAAGVRDLGQSMAVVKTINGGASTGPDHYRFGCAIIACADARLTKADRSPAHRRDG
jgi:hypothetical protein